MIKIKVDTIITVDIVDKLISQYNTQDICLVIDNSKKQSSKLLELVSRKYPKIIISVLGGLNPQKNKFNNEHYQKRTYYSPMELSKIIKFYNSIERRINISWTDTQKVMFVYQEICNHMEYSECTINGRDNSRNLMGVLYGKAVCSGFAMIFKEALDRLEIKNVYQNVQGSHSWNIAFVDGAYRAFELTWDCYNKKDNGCEFQYFNLTPDFYSHKYHNISHETEEKTYSIVPYTVDELRKDYKIINKTVRGISLENVTNRTISFGGKEYTIINSNGEISIVGNYSKKFTRRNGTQFILINGGFTYNLNKFFYLEIDGKELRISRIYSEAALDRLDSSFDNTIANALLSSERLERKVRDFNGYVGYIGNNHGLYYDGDFEREKLNVIR